MANYSRKLRMKTDIKRKEKVEKIIEFVERTKKVQKEAEAILRKAQEEMKWQIDKRRRKVKKWKKRDKIMLSIKSDVQRIISKEVNRKICEILCNKRNYISQCN